MTSQVEQFHQFLEAQPEKATTEYITHINLVLVSNSLKLIKLLIAENNNANPVIVKSKILDDLLLSVQALLVLILDY